MKRVTVLLMILVLGFGNLYSQDPMDIFKKYFAFRGDQTLLNDIKGIKIKAKQIQAGMPVETEYYRIGEKIYIKTNAMGQESEFGYDGDTLWQKAAGQIQIIPSEYIEKVMPQLKMLENMLTGPAEDDLKEDGIQLEFSGEVDEDGHQAYVVNKIDEENNKESYFYFDKNSYELFKIYTEISGEDDKTFTVEAKFSNYKKLDKFKINFPYEINMSINGQKVTIKYEDIEINPNVDEKIFKAPKD